MWSILSSKAESWVSYTGGLQRCERQNKSQQHRCGKRAYLPHPSYCLCSAVASLTLLFALQAVISLHQSSLSAQADRLHELVGQLSSRWPHLFRYQNISTATPLHQPMHAICFMHCLC